MRESSVSFWVVVLTMGLTIWAIGSAQAAFTGTLDYQFKSTGGTAIDNIRVNGDSDFSFSVDFVTTGFDASYPSSLVAFVGFDRTTTFGATASAMDNKITGSSEPTFNTGYWQTKTGFGMGGAFPNTNGAVRPFGWNVYLGYRSSGNVNQPQSGRLFNLVLHENLAAGEQYTVNLYSYGSSAGTGWQSYVSGISNRSVGHAYLSSTKELVVWRSALPTAVAGAGYEVGPAGLLSLNGAGSHDNDFTTDFSCTWDLNNDGIFGDAVGATPVIGFNALTSTTSGLGLAAGVHPIFLKVIDTDGEEAIAQSSLSIVPEPLSMMTLLLGLPMILRRRK